MGSIVGLAVGVGVSVVVGVGVGVGVCVTSPPGDGDALVLGDADTPSARTWSLENSAATANRLLAVSSSITTITRILKLRNIRPLWLRLRTPTHLRQSLILGLRIVKLRSLLSYGIF